MQEELYHDFTEKFLPKIQEGLVISQEYFIDLFNRYIHYLIAIDIFAIIIELIGVGIGIWLLLKFYSESEYGIPHLLTFIGGFIVVFALIFLIDSLSDLIKVIYVPEVRIYQELKELNI